MRFEQAREGISLSDLVHDEILAHIAEQGMRFDHTLETDIADKVKKKWLVVNRREKRRISSHNELEDVQQGDQERRVQAGAKLKIILREVIAQNDSEIRDIISCLSLGVPLSENISISRLTGMSVQRVVNAKRRLDRILDQLRAQYPNMFPESKSGGGGK